MKKTYSLFVLFLMMFALCACSGKGSSSPNESGLPTEVADKAELETYECGDDVIGEKVYVAELEENYECDGEKWFKSYDQTKPSSNSTKSSNSKKIDGSSDSKAADKDGSSSSSDGAKSSSSSRLADIFEPEITINETCIEVGACDAMVKTDVSTWRFVRKDDFGDDMEYSYMVDGKDLIVTIKSADGSTNSKTYSMYNMESEAGVEMAFNAAKSTCKDGGGNDNVISKTCVKDTILALPECKSSIDGALGIDTVGIKVICQENEWKRYIEYGSLTDARDGQTYKTVKIGEQIWMAQNLNYAYLVPTDEEDSSSICYEDNCALFGRHYLWSAAMDSAGVFTDNAKGCGSRVFCSPIYPVRGICPEGWHLPDFQEFETMLFFVGAKVENYANVGEMYVNVNHREFGFTIPYDGISGNRYYLTSTETDFEEGFAFGVDFKRAPDEVTMWGVAKNRFNPVRCIKDSE